MTAGRGDQIVDGYLAQLEIALADLPSTQRERIVADVRGRIAAARAGIADEAETDVFRLLDEIGEPAAAAAHARAGLPAAPRSGWLEALAIVGLNLVWPVGIVLLKFTPTWSMRQKLIGALVPPGGYAALFIGLWILARNPILTCAYNESGQAVAGICPPAWVINVLGVLFAVVITGAFWLWPAASIATGVYLVTKAWPVAGRGMPRRLALVLAIGAGPVVAAMVYVGVLIPATSRQPQPSAGGQPVPSASPSRQLVLGPGFPSRTQPQFETALRDAGYSCSEAQPSGQWVTFCTHGDNSATAIGPDERMIILVSTNLVDRDRASQLFDQVVQAACPPATSGPITSWVEGHITPGGETDIDGYHVDVSGLGGKVTLSLSRSQP